MQSGKMRKQGLHTKRHAGHGSGNGAGHASGRVVAELDVRVGVFRQPAMQTPVLVLNASYEPINICGARRALVLVLKGVARTEEEQGAVLHAARMRIAMPSVIRSAGVPQNSPSDAGAEPEEYSAARSKRLPVLQRRADGGRVDAGPCHSALARWTFDVGEPGRLLPQLQPAEGQPDAARTDGDEAAAGAAAILAPYLAAHHADDRQRGCGVAEVSLLRGRAGGLGVRNLIAVAPRYATLSRMTPTLWFKAQIPVICVSCLCGHCAVFVAGKICHVLTAASTVPSIDQALEAQTASGAALSPDGQRVVYEVSRTNWKTDAFERDLWIADRSGKTHLLTAQVKSSSGARWSPDGRWVAFASDRPGQVPETKADSASRSM